MISCFGLRVRQIVAVLIAFTSPELALAQDGATADRFITDRVLVIQAQDLKDGPPFSALVQKLGIRFQPAKDLGGGLKVAQLAEGPEFLAATTTMLTVPNQGRLVNVLHLHFKPTAACIPLQQVANHANCGTAKEFTDVKLPGVAVSNKPDGLACQIGGYRTTQAKLQSRDFTCIGVVVVSTN